VSLFDTTFADPQFPEYVAAQLKEYGMPADALCFELMNEEIAGRMQEAVAFAAAMRRIGCRLMLTCFAADSAVLDLLKVLPVQYLRIEGDMDREVARDPSLAWLRALCRVSRTIGVSVITGQVESGRLRARLCEVGVEYVQGYGIMRAMPHEAAA
jgi:EAL domain-containing protein (putative c-di-GMP-specific phosphodiesterase class I)